MIVTIEGHHGTSHESATLIQKSNYELSVGDKEWLGDGVYFFIEGLSSKTVDLAEKWAIANAWDNNTRNYKYYDYCILKSIIESHDDNILDLTIEEGLEVYEYLIEKYKSKIASIGKRLNYLDGLIINAARGEGILPIDIVIGNFYIKFTKERINAINLRINNCTVCTVFDPVKNIVSTTIVKMGRIK